MLRSTLQKYAAMQQLAADTMQFIQNHIQVGQTADQIKTLCETYMLAHGAQSFWYYDVGALVFHHPDTLLSVSGREYVPAHTCIQSNHKKFSRVRLFTFEPHIALINGTYGFKKENIYYFDGGHLRLLADTEDTYCG